jgi:GH15 family glucan-1,4-alpha-glucosidase
MTGTQPEPTPIRDYALIGDCHGAALVSKDAGIHWYAPLRFDGDPTFFRLLDHDRGGAWEVEVEGARRISRAYLPDTAILRTRFETETGVLDLLDFMPVGRTREAGVHDYVSLAAPGWLVRRAECVSGAVKVRMRLAPRSEGFDLEPPGFEIVEDGAKFADGSTLWCAADVKPAPNGDGIEAAFALSEGERRNSVLTRMPPLHDPRLSVDDAFDATCAFWREWSEYSRYRGPYAETVQRSAITLKLLTYAPTGALVAAPTTSLPEEIGGGRNWDYRFCWLRDATFALFGLSVIGYSGEGRRFSEFLSKHCLRPGTEMRIMYGLDGDPFLPEHELDHLSGHAGSRPVRVGNGAAEQRQLDVFGELLDWAHLRRELGGKLGRDERALLAEIADHVCDTWDVPDQGLWEMRGPPRHFTQGKAMAWVTLDRAARLLGDRPRWRDNRKAIMVAIESEGCVGNPPALTQSFGSQHPDAALLQIPLLGLPLSERVMDATTRLVERDLRRDDAVYRYLCEDGLEGGEGAFFMTSFWLVDALLATGRGDEARALFERLLERANDVGLYSEEMDPETGDFLGNFPQAFTHLAVIASAQLLHLHDKRGKRGLAGTNADRARYLVGSTEGLRALGYALIRNCRVRLRNSRASVLRIGESGN